MGENFYFPFSDSVPNLILFIKWVTNSFECPIAEAADHLSRPYKLRFY